MGSTQRVSPGHSPMARVYEFSDTFFKPFPIETGSVWKRMLEDSHYLQDLDNSEYVSRNVKQVYYKKYRLHGWKHISPTDIYIRTKEFGTVYLATNSLGAKMVLDGQGRMYDLDCFLEKSNPQWVLERFFQSAPVTILKYDVKTGQESQLTRNIFRKYTHPMFPRTLFDNIQPSIELTRHIDMCMQSCVSTHLYAYHVERVLEFVTATEGKQRTMMRNNFRKFVWILHNWKRYTP
jgi:hypothetical protein